MDSAIQLKYGCSPAFELATLMLVSHLYKQLSLDEEGTGYKDKCGQRAP